jgi:MoxR-like ATPase
MRTNTFVLRKGPVFANVVLGDEINRAPPKTQAALLEAMQEQQVTLEGETLSLPDPFFVLATQNPVEHEGVYVLPEAQLDRFLLKLEMGYPSAADEERMLREHAFGRPEVRSVLQRAAVLELCANAEQVNVTSTIQRYIVSLSRWTRTASSVVLGASPRASLALVAASRARALLTGRDYVTVEDVRALAPVVFAHRLIVSSSALLDGLTGSSIVKKAIRDVPYDPA